MADVVGLYTVQNWSADNNLERSGLDQFSKNIDALNDSMAKALPDMVMEAALLIEAEIRQRAPVDTGALVRSLDAKSARRQDSASAIVEIKRSGPDQTEHYAIFQEFGTHDTPARPFFRPGVAAAEPKVNALVENKINGVLSGWRS